jgi:hypothetical protein
MDYELYVSLYCMILGGISRLPDNDRKEGLGSLYEA